MIINKCYFRKSVAKGLLIHLKETMAAGNFFHFDGGSLGESFATGLIVILRPEVRIIQGTPMVNFNPRDPPPPDSVLARFLTWLHQHDNPEEFTVAGGRILEEVRNMLRNGLSVQDTEAAAGVRWFTVCNFVQNKKIAISSR